MNQWNFIKYYYRQKYKFRKLIFLDSINFINKMEFLTNKLNKWMINIINEYYIIDINKICEIPPKFKLVKIYSLNPDLTIEDIMVKAYQMRYCGFFVDNELSHIIEQIYTMSTQKFIIHCDGMDDDLICEFNKDRKNLNVIDIIDIDNVIFRTVETVKLN